jgi:hypothetical protein
MGLPLHFRCATSSTTERIPRASRRAFGVDMSRDTNSKMTPREVREARLRAMQDRVRAMDEYIAALADYEREIGEAPTATGTTLEASPSDDDLKIRLAKLPLTESLPLYLASCKEPQTVKQMAAALLRAGREFETNNPVHAVRTALKKVMVTNPDIFHVNWARYHLRSKYRKSQLEKLLAKNVRFGTGGRTSKEHGRRTAEGIARRRKEGRSAWGPNKKATPEVLDRAKQMLREGVSLRETCKALHIAIPTLYQYGIRQRSLKKEGQEIKEAGLASPTESDNVVQFAKAQNE